MLVGFLLVGLFFVLMGGWMAYLTVYPLPRDDTARGYLAVIALTCVCSAIILGRAAWRLKASGGDWLAFYPSGEPFRHANTMAGLFGVLLSVTFGYFYASLTVDTWKRAGSSRVRDRVWLLWDSCHSVVMAAALLASLSGIYQLEFTRSEDSLAVATGLLATIGSLALTVLFAFVEEGIVEVTRAIRSGLLRNV